MLVFGEFQISKNRDAISLKFSTWNETSKSILKILHGCIWIFSRFQYLGVCLCRWVSRTHEKFLGYLCQQLSDVLFQVRNCNLNAFKRKKHFASRMCKTPGANTIKVLFHNLWTISLNHRILFETEDLNLIQSLFLKNYWNE